MSRKLPKHAVQSAFSACDIRVRAHNFISSADFTTIPKHEIRNPQAKDLYHAQLVLQVSSPKIRQMDEFPSAKKGLFKGNHG